VGAMMFTETSNIFDDMIFSHNSSDAVLVVLAIFVTLIVLPQSIAFQGQAKYFASISQENDSIPCNPYLIGLIIPWLTAILVSHLQIFAMLINWTSLLFTVIVSVFCSLLMWTIQMEESMIHENNFKESIRMLVVSDKVQ
jgi:uncharacterized protein YacL